MNIYNSIQEVKDIGQILPNSLINADCLEAMKYIEDKSIDMVMTDPPYGTTGEACANLNHKFIGIELDEEYFKIAVKRIKKASWIN
jgi:DNA modification methylase